MEPQNKRDTAVVNVWQSICVRVTETVRFSQNTKCLEITTAFRIFPHLLAFDDIIMWKEKIPFSQYFVIFQNDNKQNRRSTASVRTAGCDPTLGEPSCTFATSASARSVLGRKSQELHLQSKPSEAHN